MRRRTSAGRRYPRSILVGPLIALFVALALVGGAFTLLRPTSQPSPGESHPVLSDSAVATGTQDVRGGSYAEGEIGAPATFIPLLASSRSERDLSEVLFDGLTRVNGKGEVSPDLADHWTASDDGKSYTFTMCPDARWHDGDPVTSQDVRFTVGMVQDADFPGDPSLSRFWRGVVVETPDDGTVIFHLREPFSAFPSYATLPILPKHLLGGVLARDLPNSPYNLAPVGTGPFVFAGFDQNASVVNLRANDNYFGTKPNLSSFSFRYYRDSGALLMGLKSGEIQGTGALPPSLVLQPGAIPKGLTAYAPVVSGYTALFFNLRNPLFASTDVRHAIDMAVDRATLINTLLPNQAVAGNGPIPEPSWSFAEQPQTYDPSAAASLLASAGWKDSDNDGVLDNGSSKLSFPLLVNADDPARVAVATELSRELATLKIHAEVRQVSSSEVQQSLSSRQFTAAVYGWRSPTGDPDCFQVWDSSQADDGLNFSGLRSQSIDTVLEQARQATGKDQRAALYAQFQQEFDKQVPAVILYYPRYLYLVSNKIGGVRAEPIVDPSDRLADAASWHMTAPAKEASGS